MQNKTKMPFNPMTDVPTDDEEAMVALERSDTLLTKILQRLYECYRGKGLSLLEAYEKTLLDHVDSFDSQQKGG